MEFEIEDQAMSQCFIGFGVCKGTHDYLEGRSAMAAKEAWMMSTQRFVHTLPSSSIAACLALPVSIDLEICVSLPPSLPHLELVCCLRDPLSRPPPHTNLTSSSQCSNVVRPFVTNVRGAFEREDFAHL